MTLQRRYGRYVQGDAHERFWAKVDTRGACWEWTGGRSKRGYGTFSLNPRSKVMAHRFAYGSAVRPVPAGMFVCHHCDNRLCCRPTHLYVGTHADNMRDRASRGRAAFGLLNGAYTKPERRRIGIHNGQAKLTPADVLAIRAARQRGMTYPAITRQWGIGLSHAHRIVNGQAWSHVLAAGTITTIGGKA